MEFHNDWLLRERMECKLLVMEEFNSSETFLSCCNMGIVASIKDKRVKKLKQTSTYISTYTPIRVFPPAARLNTY